MDSIYGLFDPETGECRYVGKTSRTIEKRLLQHLQDARRRPGEIPRFRWINALLAKGSRPQIRLLESDCGDWREAERRWIADMKATGDRLLNCTDGGDGISGCVLSEATKRKMSEAAKRRYQDPLELARLAEFGRLARLPDAAKRNADAIRAAYQDPAARARLSAAAKAACARPEVRAAKSAARKGRHTSPETKAKLRALALCRDISDETRAKMSASRAGKQHSAETKEKIRQAALRRYGRLDAAEPK